MVVEIFLFNSMATEDAPMDDEEFEYPEITSFKRQVMSVRGGRVSQYISFEIAVVEIFFSLVPSKCV